MTSHEDTNSDLEIKLCIQNCQSFIVVAGAGSGKTGSLVKALKHIHHLYGKKLRAAGQKVACITYTNAAVKIIEQRTGFNELFEISTIHSFLWSLINNYQNDIRDALSIRISQRIEQIKTNDDGGSSKRAIKARKLVDSLSYARHHLSNIKQFSYNDNAKQDYLKGYLDHDDIIEIVSIMIFQLPMLRKIIGQRFPYILIDEAQDMSSKVMESLNLVASHDGLPIIGYFGDPMQQIYDESVGEFKGPDGSVIIKKQENYRCSTEVIKLLNRVRQDIQQIAGNNNSSGSVEIRLIKAENGSGERNTYSELQLQKALKEFNAALAYFKWQESKKTKCLFLTRQMIAHRLGFSKLNRLFNGEYASFNSQEAFKKGSHFVLKPILSVLLPLVEAHSANDRIGMIKIMREHSPLLDPKGINEQCLVYEVIEKARHAIDMLVKIWPTGSIKNVLSIARQYKLINVNERLAEHLDRSPREEAYDDIRHSQEKADWLIDTFLTYKTDELLSYRNFICDFTTFSTQHGVKGDEFEKVLVVFDDIEANWNNYSFSRLLTPRVQEKEPTDGQRQRSLNLAYVCFSRAIQDLRIILFTINPMKAKQELIDKGLFFDYQISIQE